MKRVFSAWGVPGCELAYFMTEGVELPSHAIDTPVLLWTVEVGSFEEAQAIRNLRNGWEPTPTIGPAEPCPQCGANHYPQDSGQCWRCNHVC